MYRILQCKRIFEKDDELFIVNGITSFFGQLGESIAAPIANATLVAPLQSQIPAHVPSVSPGSVIQAYCVEEKGAGLVGGTLCNWRIMDWLAGGTIMAGWRFSVQLTGIEPVKVRDEIGALTDYKTWLLVIFTPGSNISNGGYTTRLRQE